MPFKKGNHASAKAQVRKDTQSAAMEAMAWIKRLTGHRVDLEHGEWFRAYTPQEEDGCYIVNKGGLLNEGEDWTEETVCWQVSRHA